MPTDHSAGPSFCQHCISSPVTATSFPKERPSKGRWQTVSSFLLSFGVAFFPKCPICWAAYMSIFSTLGFEAISYQPWMLPVMIVLLLANVGLLYYIATRSKRGLGPLLLSLLGVLLILGSKFFNTSETLTYLGLSLMLAGTVWNVLPEQFITRSVFTVRQILARLTRNSATI